MKVAENIVRSLHELENFGEEASSCKGIVRLGMMDALADYLGSTQNERYVLFWKVIQICIWKPLSVILCLI